MAIESCEIEKIISINQLIDSYDVFFIDIWGVIHDGLEAYPGVVDCLNHLIALKKTILFLSNAPRPGAITMQHLKDFGIHIEEDMMLTSGDTVREYLHHWQSIENNTANKKLYHLGALRNQDILADINLNIVNDVREADHVLLSAFMDEDEDLNQYDSILKTIAELNIPTLCANSDKIVIHGKKNRYCAGTLADKLESFGGIVEHYGKPHSIIYEAAFRRVQQKRILDKKRILMIGDTFETDILGARQANIDSALVLTGNMQRLLENKNFGIPKALRDILGEQTIKPTWIIKSLSF
jgi:HAD superfamily hydrolase (TIGR01459 family)